MVEVRSFLLNNARCFLQWKLGVYNSKKRTCAWAFWKLMPITIFVNWLAAFSYYALSLFVGSWTQVSFEGASSCTNIFSLRILPSPNCPFPPGSHWPEPGEADCLGLWKVRQSWSWSIPSQFHVVQSKFSSWAFLEDSVPCLGLLQLYDPPCKLRCAALVLLH